MAKKTKLESNIINDDSTLDNELDIPELDFDLDPPPDDRSPAKKIVDASIDQVKETVTGSDFIGKFLRKALPDVYGEVYETAASVGSSTRELYNTAVKEIKPSINEVAKATDKLIPQTSKRTKKAIDRIKNWSSSENSYSAASGIDHNEAAINIEIGDIFKNQALEEQRRYAETDAEGRVQQSLDIIRHKQSQRSLGNIDANISRLTQYQEKITAAYQKKSLELQYRSYFATTDALNEAKRANEVSKTLLQNIQKNTALPEFVKIKGSERFKEVARTKVMESLLGNTRQFIQKMFGNVKNVVKDSVDTAKEAFSMGAMVGDAVATGQEMGMGGNGIAGTLAGVGVDEALKYGAGKAGEKYGKFLQKNEKFASATETVKSVFGNLPAFITDWANKEEEDDNIVKSLLRSAVKSVLPSQNADLSLATDSIAGLREPGIFTNQTNKSINEVIPGYLARILREIKVIRTGDESISLPTYDYYSNRFSDTKKLAIKIKSKLFSEGSIDVKERTQKELLDKVDPDNQLDEKTRTALIDKLIKDMMTNKLVSHETLTNPENYYRHNDLRDNAQVIADMMSEYFTKNGKETDTTKSTFKRRNNQFNDKIRYLSSIISNPAAQLQELINLGQYDEVRGVGLFDTSTDLKQKSKIKDLLQEYPEAKDLVTIGKFKEAADLINKKQKEKPTSKLSMNSLFEFQVSENDLKPKESSDSLSLESIISSFSKDGFVSTAEAAKMPRKPTPQQTGTYQSKVNRENFNYSFRQPDVYQPRNMDTNRVTQAVASQTDENISSLIKQVIQNTQLTADTAIKISEGIANIKDTSGQERYKTIEDIITTIRDSSSSSDNTLKLILEKLDSVGYGSGAKNKNDSILSRMGNIAGDSLNIIKRGLDFGLKTGTALGRTTLNYIREPAGKATKAAKSAFTTVADFLIKKRDVYVNGETTPRLFRKGFENGEYIDSITRKIIENIGDLKNIKGDVLDKNGDIVLLNSEIKDTFVKSFNNGLETVYNLGRSIVSTGMNFLSAGIIFANAKKVKNIVFDLMDKPIDIYLKDKLESPILLAIVMKNGGYVSATSAKIIDRPSAIDGPIKTLDGNFALTLEQLKEGIVDKDNKPIRTPLMKLLGFGMGIVRTGISAVLKTGKLIGDAIMGGIGISGDFLKGFANSFKELFNTGFGGKKSLEVLEQIRDILKDRLPEKKRKMFGDKDGDGDRDGGWQDLAQNKKDKTKEKAEYKNNTVKADRKNTFDALQEKYESLKDSVKGLFGDKDGIDIDIDSPDGKRNRRNKRLPKGKKPGLLRRAGGKLLDVGKSVGRFGLNNGGLLLRGAGAAGAAYSGYNAVENFNKGEYGSAAIDAGLAGLGVATTVGGLSGITGLAGLGAIISSPVVIGATALGLTAYGGYKLYKALKSYKPFTKLRMAQYGFTTEESSKFDAILEFEDLLVKQVRYDENENAELDDKGLDYSAMLKIFDLKPDSKDSKEAQKFKKWQYWYSNRFKPVFMTHMTALKKLEGKTTFSSIDDSDDAEIKNKYLNAVKFPEGRYDITSSPFDDLPKLRSLKPVVLFNIQEIEKELNKELEDKKNGKLGLWQAFKEGKLIDTVKDRFEDFKKDNVFTRFKDTASNFLSNLTLEKIILAHPILAPIYKVTSFLGTKIQKSLGYGVDAAEAVRFKTYGLTEMQRSKVISLRNLEEFVQKGITYQTDNTALWKGSLEEVKKAAAGDFGFNKEDAKAVESFLTWFSVRFLPVYTKYVGSLRAATNKGDKVAAETALGAQDKLSIAKQIAASEVWSSTSSPWPNFKLNTTPTSVQENMNVLETEAKDAVLREQKAQQQKKEEENKKAGASVKADVAKVPESTKSAYTDRRSEQVVQDKSIDKRMQAVYGRHWEGTMSEKDKADARSGMQTDIENQSKVDPVNKAKDVVPGQKGIKRSDFQGFGGEIDDHIKEAAAKYGMDEKVLRGFIKMEGGWTGKMSPTGAIGTGQFIQSTWNGLSKSPEGKEIGMSPITSNTFRTENDPRHDKRTNTLATALLAKKNAEMLKKAGLEPTGENLYMMHNIGPGVIKALKGENVSDATMQAMKVNGWKPGMTAVDFVEYQKGRFNQHFASANNGTVPEQSPTKVNDASGQWNDYSDKSKAPQANTVAATQSETKAPVYTAGAQTKQPEPVKTQYRPEVKPTSAMSSLMNTSDSSANRMPGGYAQSVQNTKPEGGAASTFTPSLKQAIEKTPDMLNFNTRRVDPNASTQLNMNGLKEVFKPLETTATESLSVQRQMLEALGTISDKINPQQLMAALQSAISGAKPASQEQQASETSYTRPMDKSRDLSHVPVGMTKTAYSVS